MIKIRELYKHREIEVFITLAGLFPELKINFDVSDDSKPYPCSHTVLRIEGTDISADKIKSAITHMGFNCEVLEEKICKG